MNKTPRKIAKLILSTIVPTVLMSSFNVNAAPGILQNVPFAAISTSVQPNILFLLDDSGSMNWESIRSDGTDELYYIDLTPDSGGEFLRACSGFNRLAYDPAIEYLPWDGVDAKGDTFADQDPKAARLNPFVTEGKQEETDDAFNTQPLSGWVDLLALEDDGGAVAGYVPWDDTNNDGIYQAGECDGDLITLESLIEDQQVNFANWYSYYRSRAFAAKNSILSVIQVNRARVGVAGLIGGMADGLLIRDVDNIQLSDGTAEGDARRDAAIANKAALMESVASSRSSGGTPLKRTLVQAGEYFDEEGSVPDSFFGSPASYKTENTNTVAYDNTVSDKSPILNEANGGTCQANYTVLFTDGFASGDAFQTQADIANADSDGARDFDGGNFADGISGTLADVAMRYLEEDLSGSLTNNTGINDIRRAGEFINHQHMSTYTIGFGVNGTLSENPSTTDTTFAWPNAENGGRASIDDMRHAAWNGRGKFLSSSDPQQLITDINNVFTDINQRSQLTTAASSVSSGLIQENSLVFQTQFDSDDWTGNLFTYRFDDAGIVDTSNPIFNVQEVLNARVLSNNGIKGTLNAEGYSNSREIITKLIEIDDITSTSTTATTLTTGPGIAFRWGSFSTSQKNIFKQAKASRFPSWDGTKSEFGRALHKYIKGDSTHEVGVNGEASPSGQRAFRDRSQRYLGAVVNSSPQFVGVPSERYPNAMEGSANLYSTFKAAQSTRTPIVYVGANDGMLHAFDVSVTTTTTTTSASPPVTTTAIAANSNSGNEVFAYIPAILTADLPQLAQPAFEFDSLVDATPTVRDVFVDADGAGSGTVDAWRTYLVGGLRNGGRGIYALDVTDPATTFASASADGAEADAKAAEIVRFEYTHEDLGFTYSRPQIAKMNDGSWVTVVGNGYNSVGDGAAKLFLIDLETGLPLSDSGILETNEGARAAGLPCTDTTSDCNGLSSPTLVDLNGDFKVDRIYAGDLHGNMWVFDVQDTTKANWTVEKLFTATQTGCTGNCRQPITTRPEVTLHPLRRSFNTSPNILVLFGTGQFIAEGDASITENQSFYSVWDTGTAHRDLTKTSLTARSFGGSVDNLTVTGNAVAYDESGSPADFGWYIDLSGTIAKSTTDTSTFDPFDRGRITINPIISGSLVFFITTIPSGGEVCRAGEVPGFLTALDFATGKTPNFPVFTDSAGIPIASSTIPLNNGAVGLGLDTTSDGTQTRVTNIDGTITQNQVSNVIDIPSGRKSWSILR